MESKLGARLAGIFGIAGIVLSAVVIGSMLREPPETSHPIDSPNAQVDPESPASASKLSGRAEGFGTIVIALIPAALLAGVGYGIGYVIDVSRQGTPEERKSFLTNLLAIGALILLFVGIGLVAWLADRRNR